MQGGHDYYFFLQFTGAEVVKVIKTAAQLKKGLAGVQKCLGSQHAQGAYNSGTDDLNLSKQEWKAGFYLIISRLGIFTGEAFCQGCNIDLLPGQSNCRQHFVKQFSGISPDRGFLQIVFSAGRICNYQKFCLCRSLAENDIGPGFVQWAALTVSQLIPDILQRGFFCK